MMTNVKTALVAFGGLVGIGIIVRFAKTPGQAVAFALIASSVLVLIHVGLADHHHKKN